MLGIETEYGISAPERPEISVDLLAAAVVAHCTVPSTGDETWSEATFIDDLHNRMLGNGGRFYVDHAHPEYCTPETTTALDATLYDASGEAIVARAAAAASEEVGARIAIFKNNTDAHGNSYGTHENYQLTRETPWQRVVVHLTTFLVTRQPLVGAGRVTPDGFHLTQRAGYLEALTGIETTIRRPIVNTRAEPHAPRARWRRVHVIVGDANRSQFATHLKLGVTALILRAVEADVLPDLALADPLAALRTIDADATCRALVPLADGRRLSALDVQEALLEAVRTHADRLAADPDVLSDWQAVVDDLRADPDRCADRLDWVAKRGLIQAAAARLDAGPGDARLARLDLSWAELGPASVFERVRAQGNFDLLADAAIEAAVIEPPSDTRAWLRGTLVQTLGRSLVSAGWESATLRGSTGRLRTIGMGEPLNHTRATHGDLLAGARGADAVADRLAR